VLALPLPAGDDFPPEKGFTSLFNGKDLSGWSTREARMLSRWR
jgi:hypothetical protein